jgi:hypothetical protein
VTIDCDEVDETIELKKIDEAESVVLKKNTLIKEYEN